jgi:hypothetical protein
MKQIMDTTLARWRPRATVSIALGILSIWSVGGTSGEVTGPVVGFVRVEVTLETQWVGPPVRPWAPQTDAGETAGQVLKDFLGEEFRSSTDAEGADLIGLETDDSPDEVSMMWRDTQGQWRDPSGEAVEPIFTEGFWLELKLDPVESESGDTRELVLCGEAVW